MVIGSQHDKFVRRIIGELSQYGVVFSACADIYDAFAKLLERDGLPGTLIIGRLANLSRENGRFFVKAASCGGACRPLAAKRLKRLRYG